MRCSKTHTGRYELPLEGTSDAYTGTFRRQLLPAQVRVPPSYSQRRMDDGRAQGVGSTGQIHPRGSMSLVNVAYAQVLTWANPTVTRLEDQAVVPMYRRRSDRTGARPIGSMAGGLETRRPIRALFVAVAAFADQRLPSHVRTSPRRSPRSSGRSYPPGLRTTATTSSATTLRYRTPRNAERRCFTADRCRPCHGGIHFSNAMGSRERSMAVEFHNTGLVQPAGPALVSLATPGSTT